MQITKDGNKTVIITTHYIEEARQAHTVNTFHFLFTYFNRKGVTSCIAKSLFVSLEVIKFFFNTQIGLMRSGRLLAEESPRALLTMYNCASLEDVFLKLSRKQGQTTQPTTELNISNNISMVIF